MAVQQVSASRQPELDAAEEEHALLRVQRQRLFALIGSYQRALHKPDGAYEAVDILRAILPRSEVYFSLVEVMLDRLAADGAAPHRDEHRQILHELSLTIEHCAYAGAGEAMPELSHALDGLVIREVMIRLRSGRPI